MTNDTGEISDGYHTFNELYEHRHTLFIALAQSHKDIAWRARANDDGSVWDGWFVAGMHLGTGDVSYHLPIRLWRELEGIETLDKAPEFDGHKSNDVIIRLRAWAGFL